MRIMMKFNRSVVTVTLSAAVLVAIAVPPVLSLYELGTIDTASVILIAGMIIGFSALALIIAVIRIQHKSHRAELASQNQRLQDAFENLGQGLTMYDHNNKLVICN